MTEIHVHWLHDSEVSRDHSRLSQDPNKNEHEYERQYGARTDLWDGTIWFVNHSESNSVDHIAKVVGIKVSGDHKEEMIVVGEEAEMTLNGFGYVVKHLAE